MPTTTLCSDPASDGLPETTAQALEQRHIYLINCGPASAAQTSASAASMGFKAWNLLAMARLGLPVPPALVLGTRYASDKHWRARATDPHQWQGALQALEEASARRLGDARRPLLLAVRSGAPVSMPGMMETLLNIGLCDTTVDGFIRQTGNPRLVWDAYRRLVQGYGEVVAGIDADAFTTALYQRIDGAAATDLDFSLLRDVTRDYLALYEEQAGAPFPQVPLQQLQGAIGAVLDSWRADKARQYRELNQISASIGTAVTLQTMVFGNSGGNSGAGVGFSRNPITGANALWVDFLFNAQGEDVVSGRRNARGHKALTEVLPEVWQQLQTAAQQLEQHFGDMQDIEFTVEDGQLFLLQTRSGKRTPGAAARIALDLADAGIIERREACRRLQALPRAQLAQVVLASTHGDLPAPLGTAASASSGIASGVIALDEAAARHWHSAGHSVILVRTDAETHDIAALDLAGGLLTRRGARTSHAAVVARQLGKVCLVGCDDLHIDLTRRTITLDGHTLAEGQPLTLDGNHGLVYSGTLHTRTREDPQLLARIEALCATEGNHE